MEKHSHKQWRNIFCRIISIALDCFCKQPFNADYTTDNVSMGMFFHFDEKYESNMVPHSVCVRYLRCLRQHKVQAYNEERNQHWNRRMLSENDRTTVEETKRKIQL